LGIVGLLIGGASLIYSDFKSLFLVICKQTKENIAIIKNCQTIGSGIFRPTFYLPNTTIQMFYEEMESRNSDVKFEKYDVICRDGGQV